MPEIGKIKRVNGVAGQVAYMVTVTYDGEPPSVVGFTGSTYGGPVIMVTAAFPDGVVVTEPGRFGDFGPEWVRKFFADGPGVATAMKEWQPTAERPVPPINSGVRHRFIGKPDSQYCIAPCHGHKSMPWHL